MEAVEAVTDGASGGDVLEGVASLVDEVCCTLSTNRIWNRASRCWRRFAHTRWSSCRTVEKRKRPGMPTSATSSKLANRAEPELTGRNQVEWLNRLEAEHHNLRAALTWALDAGRLDQGLCLAGALLRYWEHHSHYAEEGQWLEQALARAGAEVGSGPGKALHAAGVVAFWRGIGRGLRRHSGRLWRCSARLVTTVALPLPSTGWERSRSTRAILAAQMSVLRRRVGRSGKLGTRTGSPRWRSTGLRGTVAGDYENAEMHLGDALARYRHLGSKLGTGRRADSLGA